MRRIEEWRAEAFNDLYDLIQQVGIIDRHPDYTEKCRVVPMYLPNNNVALFTDEFILYVYCDEVEGRGKEIGISTMDDDFFFNEITSDDIQSIYDAVFFMTQNEQYKNDCFDYYIEDYKKNGYPYEIRK